MEKVTKIEEIGLTKFNNAEYTNFSSRTQALIVSATPALLGIPTDLLAAYAANVNLMTDIVNQSRISDETALIAATDKECDDLIRYILDTIDSGRIAPVAVQREAATSLYNATKSYRGIQSLPQGQQVQQVRGLILDLSKEENASRLAVLALVPAAQALHTANERFAELLDRRSASQIVANLPSGKEVREEMDVQYDEMINRAFATGVVNPSNETAAFTASMNKLIAETNAAYNRRIAKKGKGKDDDSTPKE